MRFEFPHTHNHHRHHGGLRCGMNRGHGGGRHGFAHGDRDGFERGGFGGGRGGGGRRRLFAGDELKLILLDLIAQEPRHGYDLIRAIETRSGDSYAPSPGVVYPLLTLLADMDLIAEQPGHGARKLFAITTEGAGWLADHRKEADAALARLADLATQARRTDGAPVRRAMHNLSIAIRQRLEREGADDDTMFDVAALIDDAASKIERL